MKVNLLLIGFVLTTVIERGVWSRGITTDKGQQTHIHTSDLIKSTIYNKVHFGFINVNVFRKLRL